mgnify:CR=1 FL=1
MLTSPPSTATPFDRKLTYQAAFQQLLQLGQREIIVCERDFSESDLNSKACSQILWAFFTQASPGQLKILVHDADFLATNCPRLLQLRDQFAHCIEMRVMAEADSGWDKAFAIADQQHFWQRFYFKSYRGESGCDSASVALLQHDFALLWQQASASNAWQRLYL